MVEMQRHEMEELRDELAQQIVLVGRDREAARATGATSPQRPPSTGQPSAITGPSPAAPAADAATSERAQDARVRPSAPVKRKLELVETASSPMPISPPVRSRYGYE